MSLEIKAPTDNRLLSLYLPHKRLCKVDKWYQQTYVYHDLSEYKFNQEEKDYNRNINAFTAQISLL